LTIISTIDANSSEYIVHPWQKQIVFANSLYWIFYNDVNYKICYRTSSDGITWSEKTLVTDVYYDFSIFLKPSTTTIHLVYSKTYSALYYRQGTLNANGTISWGPQQTVRTAVVSVTFQHATVTVDSSGYPWVGYIYRPNGPWLPYVIKANDTSGSSWGTPTKLDSSGTKSFQGVYIIGLDNGKMYAIYQMYTIPVDMRGKFYNGTSWDASPTIIVDTGYNQSVTMKDNILYFLCPRPNKDLVFKTWTESGGWSSETVLAVLEKDYGEHSIGITDSTIYVYWTKPSTKEIKFKTSIIGSGSWSEEKTLATETNSIYKNAYISAIDNSKNGVCWIITVASYSLRFGVDEESSIVKITNAGGTLHCDVISWSESQSCNPAMRQVPLDIEFIDTGTFVIDNRRLTLTIRLTDAQKDTLNDIFNANDIIIITAKTEDGEDYPRWEYACWAFKILKEYSYSKLDSDEREWEVELEFYCSSFYYEVNSSP
jgi:hypothetical protein